MNACNRSPLTHPLLRLALAYRTWPSARGWLEFTLVACLVIALALPVALEFGLVDISERLPAALLPSLGLRVLLTPALLEETIFRVLLNPHPREAVTPTRIVRAGFVSLLAYLLTHPIAALLFPGVRALFLSPAFLFLVALLGLSCLFIYRRTGSAWPPVALHWLVVFGWLALGGEGILALPGS